MALCPGSKAELIKHVQKAKKGQKSGKLIKGSSQAVKEGTTGYQKKDMRGYELDGAQHSVIKDNVIFNITWSEFAPLSRPSKMALLSGKHGVTLCLCVVRRETNAHWRVQEAGVVTTCYRAALEAAVAAEQNIQPPPLEQAEMALVVDDSGIGSLHAHDEKEPTHAIAATPGMRTIAIKSGVLAVLSHFYGLSKECPYAFLEEFCRYCDIQPVPAGSTSEDYRLKAIPFVLKGDADRFFPASKTSALKREITEARQEYDEPLGQCWDRFQGLLQACPNHKMDEKEIYSVFNSGLTVDSKNDLNLAAQRDFSKTTFSQAKNILERLIEAKRSYETYRRQYRRGAVHVAEAHNDEKLEARFEQMEKKLLEAVEKARPPPPPAPKETHFFIQFDVEFIKSRGDKDDQQRRHHAGTAVKTAMQQHRQLEWEPVSRFPDS
ncbi:hypothetical protein SASPL_145388 [Salvia splendens]|uniref:Retrotransposon gag domain-containing protein n=1 Tax=Salvia splendens TaxID=180675 RepID=A0A8X8Z816_SALSN|nr:hypothetical protein SASPL_145388 [Salvia splendens]